MLTVIPFDALHRPEENISNFMIMIIIYSVVRRWQIHLQQFIWNGDKLRSVVVRLHSVSIIQNIRLETIV